MMNTYHKLKTQFENHHDEKYAKQMSAYMRDLFTFDVLSSIIGKMSLTNENIHSLMLEWSTNEDLWLRRIAIIYQRHLKIKTHTYVTRLRYSDHVAPR